MNIIKNLTGDKTFPIETCFKDRRTLEEVIRGHHQQKDGTFLLVGGRNYNAFYDSHKDKVILTIYGKSEEELIEAEIDFFKHMGYLKN